MTSIEDVRSALLGCPRIAGVFSIKPLSCTGFLGAYFEALVRETTAETKEDEPGPQEDLVRCFVKTRPAEQGSYDLVQSLGLQGSERIFYERAYRERIDVDDPPIPRLIGAADGLLCLSFSDGEACQVLPGMGVGATQAALRSLSRISRFSFGFTEGSDSEENTEDTSERLVSIIGPSVAAGAQLLVNVLLSQQTELESRIRFEKVAKILAGLIDNDGSCSRAKRFVEVVLLEGDSRSTILGVTHGDLWAPNVILRGGNGDRVRAVLVDFQFSSRRGAVLVDVATLLLTSMDTDLRRREERRLVCEHEWGAPDLGRSGASEDEVWKEYTRVSRFSACVMLLGSVVDSLEGVCERLLYSLSDAVDGADPEFLALALAALPEGE